MRVRNRRPSRRGAALVEGAVVLSAFVLLIFGTLVAGLGVYRANELAFLAREGARWASVRGPKYQADQQQAAPSAVAVLAGAVYPRMTALNQANLTATLTWNASATPPTVTFTLSYNWAPESLLPARTLTSSSTQPVTY